MDLEIPVPGARRRTYTPSFQASEAPGQPPAPCAAALRARAPAATCMAKGLTRRICQGAKASEHLSDVTPLGPLRA